MDVLDKRGGIPLVSRAARGDALLASYDAGSLAERLVANGGAPSAARSAAARIVRHAFFRDLSVVPWGPEVFAGLGIGAWAHEALAALDPAPALALHERAPAEDGTIRLLFRARDGALVESVLIPGPGRTTLCISSQVGCARACAFCETGRLGLERQLAAGEIIDQVRLARALWNEASGAPPLSNLVFMGMGEPFDNLPEVLRALRLLTDDRAFAFAPSRVTVSTVGVADKLPAFFAGTRAELAVSLNAPDDERRRAIMPINARFPLAALRDAILAALPHGRRVLFEYVLFDRWNDAPEDADLLAAYVRGIRCRVNVIPCNPGPDPALRPPAPERLDAFVARLSSHGVTTLVRRPRGRDVGGACGQLAGARRAERERSGVTEGA
ncbi:23S rRNA (adenine(2503)-C(2))-methyltransferase RlmN [Polyangium sp. y55x31]|uniref:23S rRNA (adenine(2503)-C(2))-methyltransferase RlmN n=1 Tax=Polyangium sp. y55x31 TaxID=3042688 RepID=UPI00248291E8|nr:23S rRNA (adenine(2503)-C(2))-methyltransferase RlmN [Polyangium sp. y55x31]MDI1481566.1 23S rRNA (adenine(2503)-C(2))-methyltransferase RlmN [Polyangium sp. y55x31]